MNRIRVEKRRRTVRTCSQQELTLNELQEAILGTSAALEFEI